MGTFTQRRNIENNSRRKRRLLYENLTIFFKLILVKLVFKSLICTSYFVKPSISYPQNVTVQHLIKIFESHYYSTIMYCNLHVLFYTSLPHIPIRTKLKNITSAIFNKPKHILSLIKILNMYHLTNTNNQTKSPIWLLMTLILFATATVILLKH